MLNRLEAFREIFIHAIIMACSLFVAVILLHGITTDTISGLIKASCLFAILNGLFRAIFFAKHLRPIFEKIFLFSLVTNAGLIYLVSKMEPSFHLENGVAALWESALIGIFCFTINYLPDTKKILHKKKTHLIKQAKARVVRSKRNSE